MNMELIILALLAVINGVVVALYIDLRKKMQDREIVQEKMLEKARAKADKMLDSARDKAIRIIAEAKILSKDQTRELEKRLRDAVDERLEDYGEAIEKLAADIENDTEAEVGEIKRAIGLEALEMEKTVARKLDEEYEEAKKAKLARLDEQIGHIVGDVVHKTVGRVIPVEEHIKLIKECLEEAKNEHIF